MGFFTQLQNTLLFLIFQDQPFLTLTPEDLLYLQRNSQLYEKVYLKAFQGYLWPQKEMEESSVQAEHVTADVTVSQTLHVSRQIWKPHPKSKAVF